MQWIIFATALILLIVFSATTVYAAGDVAGAIESTWTAAKSQIKTVVNNVVAGKHNSLREACSSRCVLHVYYIVRSYF